MPKTPKQDYKKLNELVLRMQRAARAQQAPSSVPCKKKSKPVGYKMQNTFQKNLAGVPGNARGGTASAILEIAAPGTGCKVRKEPIGVLRSARNANTTQGSYFTSIVTEGDKVVSDAQGRKEFGR